MAAKRHRDGEISPPPRIPPPPSRSSAVGAITPSDGANALPTLTNWGGGLMRNGAVVSNARLTDQQRSTVQRSVCTYFLQNKFVPFLIALASSIALAAYSFTYLQMPQGRRLSIQS
jgi:hypothetical protein